MAMHLQLTQHYKSTMFQLKKKNKNPSMLKQTKAEGTNPDHSQNKKITDTQTYSQDF